MANMTFKANLLPQSKLGQELGSSTQLWHSYNINNSLITGTGTAGKDAGSGDNRYQPARWTFDTSKNATDGDSYLIKIPVAGHDYGVFMSVDNGAHYYPVVLNGTGRITTHYPVNTYLQVVFEPTGSAASMFPLAGGTSRVTVSNGVFRVVNYYDSGAPYGIRVYRETSGYNNDYPLLVSRTLASSITATHDKYTNNVYGIIYDDNIPTLNPSTGLMKVPGGINSGPITITHTSGGQQEVLINYSNTISYWWGVGTGDANHGLYDNKANKWILSAGAANTWTFDGSVAWSNITGKPSTFSPSTHNHDSSYVNITGDSMTGNLTANSSATLGTAANPWHQLVLGGATNATMTADSTNPRITFQEGTGTQPVHLIYTDYNNYREPAGLKVIGGASATPAWFEVEGNIYAAAFKGNADSATAFSSNATVTLTGDTTGTSAGSTKSWSVPTTTNQLSFKNGRITSADLDISTMHSKMLISLASSSMTTNKPPMGDGYIVTYGWDNAYWGAQQAISHTKTPHMAIRGTNGGSSNDWGNWIYLLDANNYTDYTVKKDGTGASGSWGISISGNANTATKATQDESGNNIKATYASSFSISDHTITLKNKNGASLGTVTVPDNNTLNTAGSTDTSSKIFLIGATSQAANPQTYSDNQVYATNGQLDANKMRVAEHVTLQYNTTTAALDFIFV